MQVCIFVISTRELSLFLLVSQQNHSKTTESIFMKFCRRLAHDPRQTFWSEFGVKKIFLDWFIHVVRHGGRVVSSVALTTKFESWFGFLLEFTSSPPVGFLLVLRPPYADWGSLEIEMTSEDILLTWQTPPRVCVLLLTSCSVSEDQKVNCPFLPDLPDACVPVSICHSCYRLTVEVRIRLWGCVAQIGELWHTRNNLRVHRESLAGNIHSDVLCHLKVMSKQGRELWVTETEGGEIWEAEIMCVFISTVSVQV